MNRKPDPDAPDISSSPGGVLRSSKVLPWRGIVLEQCYYPAGEYTFPVESALTICLYQGLPSRLEQIRNGQTHSSVVPQGGVQVVPTGTESTWRHPNGADKLRLLLSTELLQQVATDLHQKRVEILDQFSIQDSRIEHISLALLAELAAGGSSGRLYGEGLTTALAAHIISSYSSTPRLLREITRGLPASLLRRIVSVIEDRLDEDLGLAELASEVGLSPSHFSSLFRKTTGLSPHQYIVQRRVERARTLLTATKLSISEIATMVGFYDQSHLTHQMQRVLGVTPKYLRDHLRRHSP
jgi:AraC family transcriptional regulator